jgi:glycine amidinotransferase
MAKVVNSWNEWDTLKRVIIGRPEGTNVPAPEPAWSYDLPSGGYPLGSYGPFPQEMVDDANEQMDYFVAQIEKRGAVVERIDIPPFMFNKPIRHPRVGPS